jgi:ribonuclease Z
MYDETIIPMITDVDVLYHESTFLEKHAKLAILTKHSTAKQAARIAKQADVKKLIIGHYSTRYGSIDEFKLEAKVIFEDVALARDGKVFEF